MEPLGSKIKLTVSYSDTTITVEHGDMQTVEQMEEALLAFVKACGFPYIEYVVLSRGDEE